MYMASGTSFLPQATQKTAGSGYVQISLSLNQSITSPFVWVFVFWLSASWQIFVRLYFMVFLALFYNKDYACMYLGHLCNKSFLNFIFYFHVLFLSFDFSLLSAISFDRFSARLLFDVSLIFDKDDQKTVSFRFSFKINQRLQKRSK